MLNKLMILFILIGFTVSLEAAPKEGRQKTMYIIKNSKTLKNLTPAQKKQLMEIRAQSLEEETKINNRLRNLRKEMNECMLSDNPDMKKFKSLREETMRLRKKREGLRKKYRKKIDMVIKKQSKI